jgi:hypothetical protein
MPMELVLNQSDINRAEEFSSQFGSHKPQVMIAALVVTLMENSKADRMVTGGGASAVGRVMAGAELFARLKASSDAERVLGAAFLLGVHQGSPEFTSEHIRKALSQAKAGLPENVNRAMIANAQRGFMEELGKKLGGLKSWSITQTGIDQVESLLGARGRAEQE